MVSISWCFKTRMLLQAYTYKYLLLASLLVLGLELIEVFLGWLLCWGSLGTPANVELLKRAVYCAFDGLHGDVVSGVVVG